MGVPVSACPGEVLDVPIRENNTVQAHKPENVRRILFKMVTITFAANNTI